MLTKSNISRNFENTRFSYCRTTQIGWPQLFPTTQSRGPNFEILSGHQPRLIMRDLMKKGLLMLLKIRTQDNDTPMGNEDVYCIIINEMVMLQILVMI